MTNSELLLLLGEILESNEEIQEWCVANCGKVHTVYLGIDTENPPEQGEYPLVVVYYAERVRGENSNRQTYVAEIGAGIYKKELTTPDPGNYPNLKIYSGLLLVEDFREIVEDSIFNAMPRIKANVDVTGETSTDTYYPFFRSNTVVTFEFVKTSRTAKKPRS